MKKIFLFTLFLAAVALLMAQTIEAGAFLAFSPLFAGKMNKSLLNLRNADVLGLNLSLPQLLGKTRSSGREIQKYSGQRETGFYDKPMIITGRDEMKAESGKLVTNSGADFILEKPKAIFTIRVTRDTANNAVDLPFVLFHSSSEDSDFIDMLPNTLSLGGNLMTCAITRVNGILNFAWTDPLAVPPVTDTVSVSMQGTPYLSMLKSMGARKFRICGIKCNFVLVPDQSQLEMNFNSAGFFTKTAGDVMVPIEHDRRDTFNTGIIEIPMIKEMSTFDGIVIPAAVNLAGIAGGITYTFYVSEYDI
jgi:hypothetical protein